MVAKGGRWERNEVIVFVIVLATRLAAITFAGFFAALVATVPNRVGQQLHVPDRIAGIVAVNHQLTPPRHFGRRPRSTGWTEACFSPISRRSTRSSISTSRSSRRTIPSFASAWAYGCWGFHFRSTASPRSAQSAARGCRCIRRSSSPAFWSSPPAADCW